MNRLENPDIRESQTSTSEFKEAELEEEIIQRLDQLAALSGVLSLLAAEGLSLSSEHQANYIQVLDEQVCLLRQLAVHRWG